MCDLGPVSAFLAPQPGSPNFIGPMQPSAKPAGFSLGELVGQASGAVGAFGQSKEYDDLADQRERRAGQILEATKQNIMLKRLQQSRDMGATKSRIGRAGVAMSGSAAKLVERQEILDELTIAAAKNRGVLEIEGEIAEANVAKSKSRLSRSKALQLGVEFGKNAYEGFDLK